MGFQALVGSLPLLLAIGLSVQPGITEGFTSASYPNFSSQRSSLHWISANEDSVDAVDSPLESAPNAAKTSGETEETVESIRVPPNDELKSRSPLQTQQGLSSTDMMRALGTSPRRIALSFLSASGIALAGNFLGVTSQLLTVIPEETVEASNLDTYFPRGNFKRCRSKGYTFVIPKEWVADTFIALAKAQRQTQPLDYQMQRSGRGNAPTTLPDAAYGPPGRLNQKGVSESGDTNVSIIVTPNLSGFSLQGTLGSPESAAEKLLRLSIAPEGSGRVATLITAVEDTSRGVYQFEFIVDRGSKGPPLRNISVIAASVAGDKLFTMTVVAPQAKWDDPDFAFKLRKIASSFHLTT